MTKRFVSACLILAFSGYAVVAAPPASDNNSDLFLEIPSTNPTKQLKPRDGWPDRRFLASAVDGQAVEIALTRLRAGWFIYFQPDGSVRATYGSGPGGASQPKGSVDFDALLKAVKRLKSDKNTSGATQDGIVRKGKTTFISFQLKDDTLFRYLIESFEDTWKADRAGMRFRELLDGHPIFESEQASAAADAPKVTNPPAAASPSEANSLRWPREWINTVTIDTHFVNQPALEEISMEQAMRRFVPGGSLRAEWAKTLDWSLVPDHDSWKNSVDKKLADRALPPRDTTPSVRVVRFSKKQLEVKVVRQVSHYRWHHYYGTAKHFRIKRSRDVDNLFGLKKLELEHLTTYKGVGYGDRDTVARQKLGPPDDTRHMQAVGWFTNYYLSDDMTVRFHNSSVFTIKKGAPGWVKHRRHEQK